MNVPPPAKPCVLVCQRGSRHRYAIPRLLEESGLLAGLYTDSCARSLAGRFAAAAAKAGLASPRLRALAARVPAGVPPEKVCSTDRLLFHAPGQNVEKMDLAPVYRRWGRRGANMVYSMYGEEITFLEWMKGQGAKIVVDVFVHPATDRIVAYEKAACLGSARPSEETIANEEAHSRRIFALADALFCPSQWVAEGVREFLPGSEGKIRLVPYGSSLAIAAAPNAAPAPGRILFAGRDPLRKGLHHLAEAARILRGQGMELDVRAAGVGKADIEWMRDMAEINCLGTIPMQRMREEFSQADLLVLPSLSEGQAGVVLEAMACGCPVVATRESGVDFDPDGGITVPVRDPAALAGAIAGVVGNRARRHQLAHGALRQSRQFSVEAWRERLAAALVEIGGGSCP